MKLEAVASEEAERKLIANLLVDPRQIDLITDVVYAFDFVYLAGVFKLIIAMRDNGELSRNDSDASAFVTRLKEHHLIDSLGGVHGVALLFAIPPTSAVFYAKEIRRLSNKRKIIDACDRAVKQTQVPGVDEHEITESLIADMEAIQLRRSVDFKTLQQAMTETIIELRKPMRPMIYSGLEKLDRHIGGFAGGELIVVSAKTSGGKSAFALGVADHNGSRGRPVLFLTIEMALREEVYRIWSRWTSVPVGVFRSRRLTDEQFIQLQTETSSAADHRLVFHHMPRPSWQDIQSVTKAFQARNGLALLIVDYVGLVKKTDYKQTNQDKTAEVTAGLKHLASEFDCPVMALVQLNRDASKQKTAELHNMADSASVERDADIVLNIHQPEANADSGTDEYSREIHILKYRNGRQMEITGFRFIGESMRFEESQPNRFNELD